MHDGSASLRARLGLAMGNGAQGTDAPHRAGWFMARVRDFEFVENSHEPHGRDAFHRVRNVRPKKTDAVERVPT